MTRLTLSASRALELAIRDAMVSATITTGSDVREFSDMAMLRDAWCDTCRVQDIAAEFAVYDCAGRVLNAGRYPMV